MPTLDLEARPEAVPPRAAWCPGAARAVGRAAPCATTSTSCCPSCWATPCCTRRARRGWSLDRAADGVRARGARPQRDRCRCAARAASAATTGRGLNLVARARRRAGASAPGRTAEPGKAVWCLVTGDAAQEVRPRPRRRRPARGFDDDDDRRTRGPAERRRRRGAGGRCCARPRTTSTGCCGRSRWRRAPAACRARSSSRWRRGACHRRRRPRPAARPADRGAARGDERVELVFRVPAAWPTPASCTCRRWPPPTRSPATAGCCRSSRRSSTGCCASGTSAGSVAGLRRRRRAGRPAAPTRRFEARLLRELHRARAGGSAASQRSAQLQRATARLAAAETVEDDRADRGRARACSRSGRRAAADARRRRRGHRGGRTRSASTSASAPATRRSPPACARPVRAREALRTGRARAGREPRGARRPLPAPARVQPDAVARRGAAAARRRRGGRGPAVLLAVAARVHRGRARPARRRSPRRPRRRSPGPSALRRLQDLRDELDRLLRSRRAGCPAPTSACCARSTARPRSGSPSTTRRAATCGSTRCWPRPAACPPTDHVGRTVARRARPGRAVRGAPADAGAAQRRCSAPASRVSTRELDAGRAARGSGAPPGSRCATRTRRCEAAVVLAVEITAQRRAEARTRLLAQLGDRLSRDRTEAGVLEAVADGGRAGPRRLGRSCTCCDAHDRRLVPAGAPRATRACSPAGPRSPRSFQVATEQPYGPGRTLATGRPASLPRSTTQVLWRRSPAATRASSSGCGEADLGRGAVVPLAAGGRRSARLSSAGPAAARAEDLAVLEDVGRRAGAALEGVRRCPPPCASTSPSTPPTSAPTTGTSAPATWTGTTGCSGCSTSTRTDLRRSRSRRFFARLHADDARARAARLERAVREVGERRPDLPGAAPRRVGALGRGPRPGAAPAPTGRPSGWSASRSTSRTGSEGRTCAPSARSS